MIINQPTVSSSKIRRPRQKAARSLLNILLLAANCCLQVAEHNVACATTTTTKSAPLMTATKSDDVGAGRRRDFEDNHRASESFASSPEKRAFVVDLLKMLHEQYSSAPQQQNVAANRQSNSEEPTTSSGSDAAKRHNESADNFENRQSISTTSLKLVSPSVMLSQLLDAIRSDGDIRRLTEWVQNSFNLASIGEMTTQFVVGKLASVNCPALLKPDREETLLPRFLLFNEHFVDVPFELSINPSASDCLTSAKFDPKRRTVILVHGFLAGYTIVDGFTNIKNRLLDLNKLSSEQALHSFLRASRNNGTYVLTEDLQGKVRSQQYNVIIVDWFSGANPVPRSRYIRAAVNAQVVGKLIARFLSALVVQCGTPATNLHIIAHSLGCHVTGFTGKAMNAAGHRLGKITHLDPVGLCFGRLFSQPRFRLSADDALDTQAVHVSLNLFDNPLDGAQSNFLVNGGRDQPGCGGGSSELKNSTTSSVSLLFDSATKFAPCSHLRAVALYESDLSSELNQCQLVGYRCASYDRFLAGKCGFCDATNSQCRLMGLPPISMQFRKLNTMPLIEPLDEQPPVAVHPLRQVVQHSHLATPQNSAAAAAAAIAGRQMKVVEPLFGAPSNYLAPMANEIRRSEGGRRLAADQREKLALAIERLRLGSMRTKLTEGWTSLRNSKSGHRELDPISGGANKKLPQSEKGSDKNKDNSDDDHGEDDEEQQKADGTQDAEVTGGHHHYHAATGLLSAQLGSKEDAPVATSRLQDDEDFADKVPLGGQRTPAGSLNGPLYFLGTGPVDSYCINYYQFRVLIAESRIKRLLETGGLAANSLAPQLGQEGAAAAAAEAAGVGNGRGGGSKRNIIEVAVEARKRALNASGRDMLHLTVKLSDSRGHFFKGFSMLEYARSLPRAFNEQGSGRGEPMVELTMLLNTTRAEPVRVTESIVSFYFHSIVIADRMEINYMSNISPE